MINLYLFSYFIKRRKILLKEEKKLKFKNIEIIQIIQILYLLVSYIHLLLYYDDLNFIPLQTILYPIVFIFKLFLYNFLFLLLLIIIIFSFVFIFTIIFYFSNSFEFLFFLIHLFIISFQKIH